MPIKSNQRGFSLPEIMIALGLLGGISIVTIRLIENQTNNEAHLKAKAEIQKTTALLKSILNNPESCRNMLKDQLIPTVAVAGTRTNIGFPPPLPAPSANPALIEEGLYQRINLPGTSPQQYAYKEILLATGNYRYFGVGSIQFEKVTDSNTPTNIFLPGNIPAVIDMDSVDIVIQFLVETKSILWKSDTNDAGEKSYLQRIPLMVTFDNATNRIKDCGLVVSEATIAAKQKFCKSLGNMATWSTSTLSCRFNNTVCPAERIPDVQNKNPASNTYDCVLIRDKFKAEDLFDTTYSCQSGTGRYTISPHPTSGKLRIQCL